MAGPGSVPGCVLRSLRTCFTAHSLAIGGDEGEIEVPGIVFLRGGAVGVLVILDCEGEEYTILTKQARVPIGDSQLPEIPAGMLDGSGNFKGVAASELEEEVGLSFLLLCPSRQWRWLPSLILIARLR